MVTRASKNFVWIELFVPQAWHSSNKNSGVSFDGKPWRRNTEYKVTVLAKPGEGPANNMEFLNARHEGAIRCLAASSARTLPYWLLECMLHAAVGAPW
jgi:hypothetical protein